MDTRSRLLKILTLLARNVNLKSDKLNIGQTIKALYTSADVVSNSSDKIATSETERNIRSALTRGITLLLEWDARDKPLPEIDFLLSDFESSMRGDADYYDTVETALRAIYDSKLSPSDHQQIITAELSALSQDIKGSDIAMRLYKMSSTLSGHVSNGTDITETLSEFLKDIENESKNLLGDVRSSLIGYVDFDDRDSVMKTVAELYAKEEGGAILRFGWQGLNLALQKGIRLGQFMGVSALQHSNKTGVTLNMFRHIAIFNEPAVRKPGKRPTLIRFSFEDDLSDNYQYLLKDTLYDLYGDSRPIEDMSESEVADVVINELSKRGWKIILAKANPSEWDYLKLQAFTNSLINEGLDPQLFMCDYLLKMPTTGCDKSGATGTDHRDLVRRTRNYFNKVGCAFITPFQLNTQAKAMLSDGVRPADLLPQIAGGGFTANSKQIDQELDISLLTHIVKNGDQYYQHFVVDKHRLPSYIEESKKRFFLPLPPNFMPLKSDIDREDTTVTRLRTLDTDRIDF